MAGNTGKQKRKIFFSIGNPESISSVEIKVGSGRFTKRTRGLKSKVEKSIIEKRFNPIYLKSTW